jgi:hypothetical protein
VNDENILCALCVKHLCALCVKSIVIVNFFSRRDRREGAKKVEDGECFGFLAHAARVRK